MGAPRTRAVADHLLVYVASASPTTLAVARHFGWSQQRARRELDELRDVGLVTSTWSRQRSGSMLKWRLVLK